MKGRYLFVFMFLSALLSAQQNKDTCKVRLPSVYTKNAKTTTGVEIQFNCPVKEVSVKMYNRWGELIFETRLPDGEHYFELKCEKCTKGIYYYNLKCEQQVGSEWVPRSLSGDITVLE